MFDTMPQWIAHFRPNPRAPLRLFCFPYAGGGASTYRTWRDHLPAEVEVCCVELPGRETRLLEPLFTQFAPLVQSLVHALVPLMDRPTVFFGHSMGALIAFELARTLRRQRCPGPVQLVLSGASAPQVRHPLRELVHKASHDDLVARLRRLSGTPQAVLENQELMQIVVPILRADFAVDETYQYCPEPPLDIPFTVFGGLDDPDVDELGLRAWRGLTTGPFSLHLLEGDHFFVADSLPLLRLLATEIRHLAGMTSGEHRTFSLAGGTP